MYSTAAELAVDGRIDAVAVDGDKPELVALLPELRASGLLLLLPTAAPLDPAAVHAAWAVPDSAEACVGLLARWEPWALTVAAALRLADSAPVQVTVRGWPAGAQQAAELVDLVASWCGEVVAVVAAPSAELPASELPATERYPSARVAWALLTASGATVLVSHDGPEPLVRLSLPTARLEAGPEGVRWEGGQALPLVRPSASGLIATAAALAQAIGGADVPAVQWPWPADLSDLLVVARVLEALRTSTRTHALTPVA